MEMNVTKLKLKIKDVKEEMRDLTIEERCMYNISKDGIKDGYIPDFISKVNNRLKEIGFIEAMYDEQIPAEILRELKGKFRTVTIRDATPKEVIAWHTLQSHYVCSHNMPIQLCNQCANNLGHDGCYIGRTREHAEGILEGKEVILSLTEE